MRTLTERIEIAPSGMATGFDYCSSHPAITPVNAAEEPLLLPAELVDALAVTEGAWEQWERDPDDLRRLYVQWVATPRRARERRARAEAIAYYAADGVLPQAVQRPGVVENILNALSWW